MQRNEFRCFLRLRVRWAKVDMQKIVFNAHYLMYIDTAMSDYWRALGLPYEASLHVLGGEMYVKKATVEYHASARLDDTLDVGLRCARIGNSSCLFTAGIFCGDRLLISAELVYVFADPATQTSRPVPPALRAIFEGFEAGADMAEVRTGCRIWHVRYPHLWTILWETYPPSCELRHKRGRGKWDPSRKSDRSNGSISGDRMTDHQNRKDGENLWI